MITLQDEIEFEDLMETRPLVLVCFHSTRSAYSRRTMQHLHELEPEFLQLKFYTVDVDRIEFVLLVHRFAVVAIPTLILFGDGRRADFLVGERSQKTFSSLLNSFLNSKTQSP